MGNDRKIAALPSVMVMAYNDEPVHLFVLRRCGAYLHVSGHDTKQSIGFPIDRAYVFEERKYRALRRAWETKRSDKLSAILMTCAKWCESHDKLDT